MNETIRYTIRPYDTIWMLAQVFNTTVDSIMDLNPGIDPRNLMIGQVISIKPGFQHYPSYSDSVSVSATVNYDADELRDLMRLLWEQHVFWTRQAVMGIIYDLPEKDLIIKRLLRNPTDFGNALMPFYGEDAAKEFADLLTAHLTIAAELVQAAKEGNNDAVTNADQRWHQNAEQIAEFLASINPDWSVEDWSAMMNEHLQLLADNVAEMLAGNYEASINGFDDYEMQALEMADVMAEGIAMQFPD
ncbi:MAG TPA: LysM domain-containing protein [Mobilitalea sp.]|nr:LysM domain-containing protein [Mobilitalea sp.]